MPRAVTRREGTHESGPGTAPGPGPLTAIGLPPARIAEAGRSASVGGGSVAAALVLCPVIIPLSCASQPAHHRAYTQAMTTDLISRVTDAVVDELAEWQSRHTTAAAYFMALARPAESEWRGDGWLG